MSQESIPRIETVDRSNRNLMAEANLFEVAVLPLQNMVLFPETVVPVPVGRRRSIAAVEAALSTEEKLLGCITVRPNADGDTDAKTADLYQVGTLIMIKRMERGDDGIQILVQGTERIKVVEWKEQDTHMCAVVRILPKPRVIYDEEEVEAGRRNLQELLKHALSLLPSVPPEVRAALLGSVEAVRLAYFAGSILSLGVEEEQKMLEASTADELVRYAHALVAREVEIIELRVKIANEAQTEMDKAQRDYVLRLQMKAIQRELGEDEEVEEGHSRGKRNFRVISNTAFIIMWMDPDHSELDDVANTIKDVCRSFGIHAVRADDIEHQEKITDLILQKINQSEFLVADLTGERPNVYYEVGFAHAIGKRPILYRKKGTQLHFDLSVHNVPEYKNLTELRQLLNNRFEAILGRSATEVTVSARPVESVVRDLDL